MADINFQNDNVGKEESPAVYLQKDADSGLQLV
jgi:hypothetical protein